MVLVVSKKSIKQLRENLHFSIFCGNCCTSTLSILAPTTLENLKPVQQVLTGCLPLLAAKSVILNLAVRKLLEALQEVLQEAPKAVRM